MCTSKASFAAKIFYETFDRVVLGISAASNNISSSAQSLKKMTVEDKTGLDMSLSEEPVLVVHSEVSRKGISKLLAHCGQTSRESTTQKHTVNVWSDGRWKIRASDRSMREVLAR